MQCKHVHLLCSQLFNSLSIIVRGDISNRVRTLWNSLPDTVVKAESVNSFKGRLDRFWNDQEVKYNRKADIKGTGSRSDVV